MSKLLSLLVAAAFATASVGSFAASHGGAMKDDKKMEEKKPADAKATDAKPAEKKMDDKKAADAKPADKKMDDKKPADAKPAEKKAY